ncbi:MAG: hypothetical protein DRJ35_05965 [Thermoprotei archaeon]|nr:MAG: hypothetical protein DRJ35_05965 [Thermoprotei archaeon]
MKIRITKNKRAVIISFCTRSKKFKSASERNKFFRGLYGWKQVVTKNDRQYRYVREGVLSEMPHIKVDDSVFIVALKNMQKIIDYFDEWSNKVEWNMKRIILEDDEFGDE